MSGRDHFWIAALLLWQASTAGCSWLVVKGPPENHAKLATFECSDGYELPVLDTAMGALALLLVSSGVYSSSQGNGGSGTAAVVVGIAGVGAAGWSAYGGYRDVSRCREAKARIDRR